MTIQDIINEYKNEVDYLDLEIIIANSLGKTREFILTYPEKAITKRQETTIKKLLARRANGEPIAYIVGHKEFYGLDFIVSKNTLIPRPETELMVDLVLQVIQNTKYKIQNTNIVDIGTGSGNIIISIAKSICHPELVSGSITAKNCQPSEMLKQVQHDTIQFYGTDISQDALRVAKKNAKIHNLDKKIKFLQGNLLEPFVKKNGSSVIGNQSLVITANLPYLSKEIYFSAPIDVKKYEPKSALYSAKKGLNHYERLLKQIWEIVITHQSPVSTRGSNHPSTQGDSIMVFLEISPEQKIPLTKIIKSILPTAKTNFKKDLAGKWRICSITITPLSS